MASAAAAARPLDPLGVFLDDEGGYTTVSVAVALLVSLALVFGAATAGWVMSRSADVQEVADAAALAGANAVAGFATIAQVTDACVLSMGLTGALVMGAGLVLAAVPGLGAAGKEVVSAGRRVLAERRDFARSAAQGLERLEATLPLLVATNATATVAANAQGSAGYVGTAVPFPQESGSSYDLAEDVDDEELAEATDRMAEASDRAKAAKDRADAALLAGWLADCGATPRNMRERAGALSSIAARDNPNYPSADTWSFGAPLLRARAYYAARVAQEAPYSGSMEEVTDSAVRARFYAFALDEVRAGHYEEHADGSVDIDLPSLPHNSDEMRATRLYTEAVWPCTFEGESVVIHSVASCPGAQGAAAGVESLQAVDAGRARVCPVCGLDPFDMGNVAAASTSIDNGFEHWWREVVRASEDYEAAMDELAEAQQEMREVGEDGKSAFEDAMEALSVERPKLCPPGAYGCMAVVLRGSTASPDELANAWSAGTELPAGMAVSGAVLAPDAATAQNNVLARFFDGATQGVAGSLGGGVLDAVCGVWGQLLMGYGSAYEQVTGTADSLFDRVGSLLGSKVASWLKGQLHDVIERAGFEPADMRLRKPVLCNTQQILERSGYEGVGDARSFVQSLPAGAGPREIAEALGQRLVDRIGSTRITIAELTIPGTNVTIPLTIDLRTLAGVV